MAITFTNGTPNKTQTNPARKKPNFKDQAKEFKRKQLERKQKDIQKQLDVLKTSISKPIRDLAKSLTAADPNDDPQELFNQIRPLLSKMGIANMADASKTQLMPGKTKGEDSLFKVVLRRSAQITSDEIDRIKRQEKALETVQWSSQAMELYLWHPYKAPEEAIPPGTPAIP
jgi:hypothetical protein